MTTQYHPLWNDKYVNSTSQGNRWDRSVSRLNKNLFSTVLKSWLGPTSATPDDLGVVSPYTSVRLAIISERFDSSKLEPLWKMASNLEPEITDEEWSELPDDYSENLDKYLYDDS